MDVPYFPLMSIKIVSNFFYIVDTLVVNILVQKSLPIALIILFIL